MLLVEKHWLTFFIPALEASYELGEW